jgi:hypothetical protein
MADRLRRRREAVAHFVLSLPVLCLSCSTGGVFPFGFGRQPLFSPHAIGSRCIPIDPCHRMVQLRGIGCITPPITQILLDTERLTPAWLTLSRTTFDPIMKKSAATNYRYRPAARIPAKSSRIDDCDTLLNGCHSQLIPKRSLTGPVGPLGFRSGILNKARPPQQSP